MSNTTAMNYYTANYSDMDRFLQRAAHGKMDWRKILNTARAHVDAICQLEGRYFAKVQEERFFTARELGLCGVYASALVKIGFMTVCDKKTATIQIDGKYKEVSYNVYALTENWYSWDVRMIPISIEDRRAKRLAVRIADTEKELARLKEQYNELTSLDRRRVFEVAE